MIRPPYNPYATCPKCGARSDVIATKHTRFAFDPPWDALRRTCGRCGYVWDERPKDTDA